MVVSTNQLWSSCKDGVRRSLSGRKSISFIIFASLTGNSWRRNTKEVFSQALADPARHRTHSNFDKHFYHCATSESVGHTCDQIQRQHFLQWRVTCHLNEVCKCFGIIRLATSWSQVKENGGHIEHLSHMTAYMSKRVVQELEETMRKPNDIIK